MTDSMHTTILRRMTGRLSDEAENAPLTSSRAVKLALTKSANDTIGLIITVTSMAEEIAGLDDMLASLDEEQMLIGLDRRGALAGLIAVDMQFRAAILEMQTVGQLLGRKAELRPGTGTDLTLCEPVLDKFLLALPEAVMRTEFDGWVDDISLSGRIGSARAAGLRLPNHDYRILRLNVDLGVAEREGQVLIILPPVEVVAEAEAEPEEELDWGTLFQANVNDAPAMLDARLCEFEIPLAQANTLTVGDVLPLRGGTVNSVRLLAPDGRVVSQAKLGQLGGMRAVRIEAEPIQTMLELGGDAQNISGELLGDGDSTLAIGDDGIMSGFGGDETLALEPAVDATNEADTLGILAEAEAPEIDADFPAMGNDVMTMISDD